MIFVFQSVPTIHSAAFVQLGILQRNYRDSGLLESTAGDGQKKKLKSTRDFWF